MSIETDLVAAVTNISNAVQSAIDDIRLLSGQIAGAAGDQALIADATAKLNTLAVNLQAAVSVNAPPAPSPTP